MPMTSDLPVLSRLTKRSPPELKLAGTAQVAVSAPIRRPLMSRSEPVIDMPDVRNPAWSVIIPLPISQPILTGFLWPEIFL